MIAVPTDVTELKPPLKWQGAKPSLLPHLRSLWQPFADRRLVQPFCGGLSVALDLMPERALLNDTNPYVIAFYRWLRRGLTLNVPLVNDEETYDRHRDRFNALLRAGKSELREAASLFYFLNRTGANGACRFNRQGEFNVPFGRYKRVELTKNLTPYAPVFSQWDFSTGDIEWMEFDHGDFVYADPPCDVEPASTSAAGFSWEDQERTASYLADHTGPVVLVNQATKRIDKLYRSLGYRLRYLPAPRRASASPERTPIRDVIASRNL